jgi:hypothetical protein
MHRTHTQRQRRIATRTAALVLTLTLAGCAWKGGRSGPAEDAANDPQADNAGAAWVAQVQQMRVYPSTRFAREAGQPVLEARVELLDGMGDSVKSSGQVRFELFAGDAAGQGRRTGQRLYAWDVTLRTQEDQVRYYDPVTRAYVFRLRVENLAPARKATWLHIVFRTLGPQNQRLEADALLTGGL